MPTLTELGIPVVAFAFNASCAGQGTEQPVIDKLNGLLADIVKMPDYRALMEKSGSVPIGSSPEELRSIVDAALRDAAPIIAEFGLQVD